METLSQILRQYDGEELMARVAAVDIPCASLLNVEELVEDPQLIAREMITNVDCHGMGNVKLVRTPIMFSEVVPQSRPQAPSLGQHTSEISKDIENRQVEMDQLATAGIVSQPAP